MRKQKYKEGGTVLDKDQRKVELSEEVTRLLWEYRKSHALQAVDQSPQAIINRRVRKLLEDRLFDNFNDGNGVTE